MLRVWRICSRKFATTAFTGTGAADNPGRWNAPGQKAVYCAESRALAALEVLAHVENKRLLRQAKFVAIPVDIAEALIHCPTKFPTDWRSTSPPESTRKVGARFLEKSPLPVLRVPSAVVEGEWCYLLNPAHPRIGELCLGAAEPFVFDPRVTA
jgi:RES domain-containing protein